MISIGAVSIISGAALLGVSFGYFNTEVTRSIENNIGFDYYNKTYDGFLYTLISGSIISGVGVIMLVAGIPLVVYTKKNVSLNLEVGTTTTFSFSYKF